MILDVDLSSSEIDTKAYTAACLVAGASRISDPGCLMIAAAYLAGERVWRRPTMICLSQAAEGLVRQGGRENAGQAA